MREIYFRRSKLIMWNLSATESVFIGFIIYRREMLLEIKILVLRSLFSSFEAVLIFCYPDMVPPLTDKSRTARRRRNPRKSARRRSRWTRSCRELCGESLARTIPRSLVFEKRKKKKEKKHVEIFRVREKPPVQSSSPVSKVLPVEWYELLTHWHTRCSMSGPV